MGRLEIRLFGTLALERDGHPLARLPSKRVADLLSYLLLNRGEIHPRARLAGLFWGDLDEQNARRCLNTALWRLRQVLREDRDDALPYLRGDARGVGFTLASDCWLDVEEFETRCRLAEHLGAEADTERAALYQQATDLYQADLLVDCYEDWCLVDRERLQLLYLRALGFLLRYYSERGDLMAARSAGLRILECDPLHEAVHRGLMEVELQAGQPAAALRRYRLCEALLRRELGVAPMPETQALLPRMLAGGAPPPREPLQLFDPQPPDAPDPYPAVLALLAEVAATLEHAGDQLRDIAAMIEQLTPGAAARPVRRAAAAQPTVEPVVPRLRRASGLIEDVARSLAPDPVPSRASRPRAVR